MSEITLKFLDILLGGLLERRHEKRALVKKFEVLKARILSPGLVNNLPVNLAELREFIVQNGLMESPGFNEFFSTWLTNPMVVLGVPALNVFSQESFEELRQQLNALRL